MRKPEAVELMRCIREADQLRQNMEMARLCHDVETMKKDLEAEVETRQPEEETVTQKNDAAAGREDCDAATEHAGKEA